MALQPLPSILPLFQENPTCFQVCSLTISNSHHKNYKKKPLHKTDLNVKQVGLQVTWAKDWCQRWVAITLWHLQCTAACLPQTWCPLFLIRQVILPTSPSARQRRTSCRPCLNRRARSLTLLLLLLTFHIQWMTLLMSRQLQVHPDLPMSAGLCESSLYPFTIVFMC
jgi:hypothetical protein